MLLIRADVHLQKSSKRAAATVRRHPWSFISIITTIPFLLAISLASTIVCPPPKSSSWLSQSVLRPLGLHESSETSLHSTFCYPANVYHREVLQPYVYPVLENAQDRVFSHPIYTSGVQPALDSAQETSKRLWEGPIRPIVDRTSRGARRFYLTFIQPHIPYLKARFYALTSPYSSRISHLYSLHVAPHVQTASEYARAGGNGAVDTYRYVASHPLTGHAGRYTKQGYQLGRRKSIDAYTWSRPHVLRAGNEGYRVASQTIFPKVVEGYTWSEAQMTRGRKIVQQYVWDVFADDSTDRSEDTSLNNTIRISTHCWALTFEQRKLRWSRTRHFCMSKYTCRISSPPWKASCRPQS